MNFCCRIKLYVRLTRDPKNLNENIFGNFCLIFCRSTLRMVLGFDCDTFSSWRKKKLPIATFIAFLFICIAVHDKKTDIFITPKFESKTNKYIQGIVTSLKINNCSCSFYNTQVTKLQSNCLKIQCEKCMYVN